MLPPHRRIDLIFSTGAFFDQSYTVLWGNSGMYKNMGKAYFLLELFSNLRTWENFATAYRSSKCVTNYLEKGGRSERDKLGRRQLTKLTIPPTLDRCSLSQRSSSSVDSTILSRGSISDRCMTLVWRHRILSTPAHVRRSVVCPSGLSVRSCDDHETAKPIKMPPGVTDSSGPRDLVV